jgi:hypothetical protein
VLVRRGDGFEGMDMTISVKFKAISGSVDQAAGIVWRYRDPDNYYVVRANALEDNLVLYKEHIFDVEDALQDRDRH